MGRNRGRSALYRAEREKGLTYQEIANKYGVTQQAVSQACAGMTPKGFRPIKSNSCIYPNLRNWMNENKVSFRELLRRMGYESLNANVTRFLTYTSGRTAPRKDVIDKLIKVTGLTYEELFKEDSNGTEE